MSYLRAVHETGARLTHDVKNLLQSLSNLCFMAQASDDNGKAFNQQIQRQLPQITQRLQQTLESCRPRNCPERLRNTAICDRPRRGGTSCGNAMHTVLSEFVPVDFFCRGLRCSAPV